ncbi:UNVERIFIED_ORG: glycosyltransferase involved in cell wall biosynthesis [Bacillus sp. B2I3]|nr:glycosyltransferase involved in cell wall biosynthesis [Bacillus sp. B2I3]
MIRVLQVVSGLDSGGVETMLYNYCINMDRSSVKFDFIVHDPKEGVLEKKLLKLGCNIYHVTPKKKSLLKNATEIHQIIKNGRYDIIHSHQNTSSFIALGIARINNISVRIAHSHVGYFDENIKSKFVAFPFKLFTRFFSTHFFACSDIAGRWLFGNKKKDKEVFIIKNAINIDEFSYDGKIRKKIQSEFDWEDKYVVGNVARFVPEKNHDLLIRIFKEIHKINSSAVLALIGSGELEEKIRKQVEELDLSKHVYFLGVRTDVKNIMQAMDAFILPSKFEGFGMVFLEAQTAGLMCYASANVPRETMVTDLIEYISLEESPQYWANRVLKSNKSYSRNINFDNMKISEFDIKSESRKLTDLYNRFYKN